jgi:uncharacterized ion transporter superfamily protein YfcC
MYSDCCTAHSLTSVVVSIVYYCCYLNAVLHNDTNNTAAGADGKWTQQLDNKDKKALRAQRRAKLGADLVSMILYIYIVMYGITVVVSIVLYVVAVPAQLM